MSIFLGFSFFRFYRRQYKILAIYEAFEESSKRTLHPIEIGRETQLHTLDVMKVLSTTPELFVKVPGRTSKGVNMYALRSSVIVQGSDAVKAYINRLARRDRILYYTMWFLIVVFFIVAGIRSIALVRTLFFT